MNPSDIFLIIFQIAAQMNKGDLSSITCIAFDFCETLAELNPNNEKILGEWLFNNYQKNYSDDVIATALKITSIEMPYSSLTIKSELNRLDYFIRFNSRVLELLGCEKIHAEHLYDHFCSYERHWILRPTAKIVLRKLIQRGYILVLASNFDIDLSENLIKSDINRFFNKLFISAEVGVEKPDLNFYYNIFDSMRLRANEIAMVGDDLNLDILPALKVGMKAIQLCDATHPATEKPITKVNDYFKITSLENLLLAFPNTKNRTHSIAK